MRASQLDAARLDTELAAMLKEQFLKIFSFFQPRLISAFQPELTLILELLVCSAGPASLFAVAMLLASTQSADVCMLRCQIFRFSVWAGKPTPGSALMNLRYRDERKIYFQRVQVPSAKAISHQQLSTTENQLPATAQVGQ